MRYVQTKSIVFFFCLCFLSLITTAGCHARQGADDPAAAASQRTDSSAADTTSTAAEQSKPGDAQPANLDTEPDNLDTTPASQTPAGATLSTIFSPARAPQRKTMGLLQRSFLDLADQGDQELEVAIVVDGTESMKTELAGVRQSIHQMLDDLRRYRNNEVRAAIVIYRDALSPSGEVVIPMERFTSDSETIAKTVEALQPETGEPFFHELPDAGIHSALTQLPWSADPQVTKWILMFGDAPPYAESFADPDNPKAKRRFATELLISIARRKGVSINCVLCPSSQNLQGPYEQAVAETRLFMGALTSGTDGLMLDLSYPEIRKALVDAGKQPSVGFTKIEPISAVDLMAVRRGETSDDAKLSEVRIAVIPHQPLNQVSFDSRDDAVQVATALSHKLAQLPGVRVASISDIERQIRRLRNDGLDERQAIRGLAGRLGVDYVVWGSVEPATATVQTAAYRRSDGQQVVKVSLAGGRDRGELASVFLAAVGENENADDQVLSQLMQRMQKNALNQVMAQPMADDAATSRELLAALASLEQALGIEAGSEAAEKLLAQAQASSSAAAKAEPKNALAQWLQANVAYNQAARLYHKGETEAAEDRMRDMKSHLQIAIRERREIESPSLITEIEADYYLLVKRDIPKAIEKYQALTAVDQPMQSQRRGHWMLSGIYAGDWGTSESKTVDPVKSRRQVVEIMGNWPDSPETRLLKRWLRWNDEAKKTEFNFLPQMNIELSNVSDV